MRRLRFLYLLLLIPIVVFHLQSCSEDRGTDLNLTDLAKVQDMLLHDATVKTAFPRVWIDTTSRFDNYAKQAEAFAPVNPLDYWVDVVAYGCTISIVDSCAPDEFNEGDSCNEIQLGTGIRAKTYIANILDTIVCKYNIVERSDSSITTKTVKYKETQTAIVARLDKFDSMYGGFRLYAIGRQRFGVGYSSTGFPVVDSIVVQSRARDEMRRSYFPVQRIRYMNSSEMLSLYPGEPIRVTVYTRARFENPPITDAYVHFSNDGVWLHEWMGTDVSTVEGKQIFEWDLTESSGGVVGTFSQIAVELFQEQSLRSDIANQFANMIWAMTYRIES